MSDPTQGNANLPTAEYLLELTDQMVADVTRTDERFADLTVVVAGAERGVLFHEFGRARGCPVITVIGAGLDGLFSTIMMDLCPDLGKARTLALQNLALLKVALTTLQSGAIPDSAIPDVARELCALADTPIASLLPDDAPAETPPPPPEPDPPTAEADTEAPFTIANLGRAPCPVPLEDREIFSEFVIESLEHLESIEQDIMELEDRPDDADLINAIFRPIHSMKGGAGFLGLTEINQLAHETETLLDRARKHQVHIHSGIVDLVLASVDMLKQLAEKLSLSCESAVGKTPAPERFHAIDVRPLIQRVQRALATDGADTGSGPPAGNRPPAPAQAPKPQGAGRLGEILIQEGALSSDQVEEALGLQEAPMGEILVRTGMVSREKVDEALSRQTIARGAAAPGAAAPSAASSAIKVDIAKLDALVNLVGELVIAQSLVDQNPLIRDMDDPTFQRDISLLTKLTKDMQDRVMALRMLPIKQTFQKMTRLVRDVSQKAGKRVELVLAGEETELDKTVIEQIGDPLVHLVRNSVDHGIDSEAERAAAGKPAVGRIRLNAFHQGESIVIEIEDDGRGLDCEKIRAKAIKSGVIDPNDNLAREDIQMLIFQPGFSTADKITDISGRGVGMDVVKRNIEKLRGRIELWSEEKVGTRVTIRLPLTLAIIDGMIVQVGREKYIIPTTSIRESLRPTRDQVLTVTGKGEMINVRGSLIPLIRIHSLYGVQDSITRIDEALAIVVEEAGRQACLLIDELLGQQQIVIKSLGEKFAAIQGVAGASILGDGKVGLILDVNGLMTLARRNGTAAATAATA